MLPGCLVQKQQTGIATELAKRLYSVYAEKLARSESQKVSFSVDCDLQQVLHFLIPVSQPLKVSYMVSLLKNIDNKLRVMITKGNAHRLQPDRQYTYNITLRRVHETTVALENQ